ncbi:MAG: dUTP diphosphatase [Bacteroidales bacterium]|nr:dUTP diphosphatase [Bacteroidales bacterium]
MNIPVKKLFENAVIPTQGSEDAAGFDLYAAGEDEHILIRKHGCTMIHTGLSMEIPKGYFGAVFSRSGLAAKQGLRPANCVGVVDADYRGEVMVALHNDRDEDRYVHVGDRIAQLVIIPCMSVTFEETNELHGTERGAGGFGSTGIGSMEEKH